MRNWKKKKTSQHLEPKYSDLRTIYEHGQNHYCRIIRFSDKEQPEPKSNYIVTSKYGIITFIPLFLLEQLKSFPIKYFLFISILQQIPDASPLGRFTTVIPMSIGMFISATISIIFDIVKQKEDKIMNNKSVEVFRKGVLVPERWSDIGVGDILKVTNNDVFPADLVLLSSSDLRGTCHIETKHLDGEANFKIKQCAPETFYYKELNDFINLNGVIECELPNKPLNNFLGRLKIGKNYPIPLDNKQFLPRGSVLRNEKWVYGVVVYAGQETKLMLNRTLDSLKESALDKIIKLQIKFVFLLAVFLSIACTICCTLWTKTNLNNHWYIGLKDENIYSFCVQVISFFILFYNTIPVNLQFYIIAVRLVQAWFINNDIDMYYEESDIPAKVRSSNLSIELGKVKYIFCGKTGTLTKNYMKLKHCSIAGELYLDGSQNKIINNLTDQSKKNDISEFFRIMTICHTVIPDKSSFTDETVYVASSSDEQALVVGSQQYGFIFHDRCPKSVIIKTTSGVEEHYEILNIIEFTNSRRRMSVIVRTPDSKIKLYCKGADTTILKRLSKDGQVYINATLNHLNKFSRAGFRTLCFACVDISESFYGTWIDEYRKASVALIDRDNAKNEVAEKIEKELRLIGATAIENELQDHVPRTVQSLMNAAIHVWLLTGDKQETAIHMGLSTKLISQDKPIIIFNESKLSDLKQAMQRQINELGLLSERNDCTVVFNGRSLNYALSKDLQMDFLKLCLSCKAVICCRTTSMQKAEVVDFVTQQTNETTLAVGDGANDVPMLGKASIGVGIVGLEGLQASNVSDYSIAQFKYLSKLLFVHGAWNYERISKMIYFCYYKGICFYALELWFAIYSGWSGQILFDRWDICTYNILFTVGPPLIIGLFLTRYSAKTRLKFPQLYSQTKNVFNYKVFWIWIIIAVLHSVLLFWICLFVLRHEVIWAKGRVGDYTIFGNVIYTCILVIVCLKASLHVQSWSFIVNLTTLASILLWFSFIVFYNELKGILMFFSMSINLHETIYKSPLFWITTIFTTSVLIVLDLAVIIIKRTLYFNNDAIIIKKIKTSI